MKRMFWYAEPVGEWEGKARSWTLGNSMSTMTTVHTRSEWTFTYTSGKTILHGGIWLMPRATKSLRYMNDWAEGCRELRRSSMVMYEHQMISRRTIMELIEMPHSGWIGRFRSHLVAN